MRKNKQSIEKIIKESTNVGFPKQNIKLAIISIFKELKETIFKEVKPYLKRMVAD